MTSELPVRNDWIVPDWPAPPNVLAFFTTRSGGVGHGPYESFNLSEYVGDDPASVAENRDRLQSFLPAPPVWFAQVHGHRVVKVEGHNGVPQADAGITAEVNMVLAIQTADCLPVLLCDRTGTAVAAAHAGWRGLCSGVIENTVRAMSRPSAALLAYLGPAIGPEHFEVGGEVRAAFLAHDSRAAEHFRVQENGKWLVDLYGLATQRLAMAGVTEVYGGGFCTFAERDRFYSYRRDRATGRMAALIWLSAEADSGR